MQSATCLRIMPRVERHQLLAREAKGLAAAAMLSLCLCLLRSVNMLGFILTIVVSARVIRFAMLLH